MPRRLARRRFDHASAVGDSGRCFDVCTAGTRVAVTDSDVQGRGQARLPARAQSIARLRHLAVGFARDNGATQAQCDDIALAVSEAVTNAVTHAYIGSDLPGDVQLRASIDHGQLIVLVCDSGNGVSPNTNQTPTGLGLLLIACVTERYELTSREPMRGLQMRMVFAIG